MPSPRPTVPPRTPGLLGFPNPVNEKAARTVAAGVLLLSSLTLALSVWAGTGWLWLTAVIALGFVARVLTGPKLSPLGLIATRLVAPHLGPPRLVPGPPKRFAQGIGAALTIAAVAALALGFAWVTQALLGLLMVAAGLESIFAVCVGCLLFGRLMRLGLIPEDTCAACADISPAFREPQRSSPA